jgi:hypothetical protein
MTKHLFAVLFACAWTAQAAQIRFGPEIPLLPELDRTPAVAGAISAASNGRDFLVAWEDNRQSGPDVYVTRVGADGQPVDPLGHHVALGRKPLVARSGNGYLIVWSTLHSGFHAQRVDENGLPLAPSRSVTQLSFEPTLLLSNGSTFLLAGARTALLLDAEGAMLGILDLQADDTVGATVRDGRYVVMVRNLTSAQYALETINDNGSIAASSFSASLPDRVDGGVRIPAFGTSSILLAMPNGYFIVGYDGTLIKAPVTVTTRAGQRAMAAGWDGRQFLIAFSSNDLVRVSADGTLIDSATLVLSDHPSTAMTIVSGANAQLIAWNDKTFAEGGLVARAASDFDALAAASAEPTHLAYTGEAQFQPQIALSPGGGLFGVWSDPGRYEVSASFNGSPITIDQTAHEDWTGWPAVAAGKNVFLVTWWRNSSGDSDRLLGQRFDFTGRAVDPWPMVLDQSAFVSNQLDHTPAAIAFDGSSFFVAWTRATNDSAFVPEKLRTIRVGEQGQPFDGGESTLVGPGYGFTSARVRSARALWTGSELLVTTTYEISGHAGGIFIDRTIATLRFDRTNTAISEMPVTPMFSNTLLMSGPVAMTRVGSRVTYAWSDLANGISVGQATADGTTTVAPRIIVTRAWNEPLTLAGIAWNGSEHVLVWLDTFDPESNATKLRGIRLDADLQPIDAEPFDVFSGPGPYSGPWLVAAPDGVLIGYSRSDDVTGQPRVFVRALERLAPQIPHRRVVGR